MSTRLAMNLNNDFITIGNKEKSKVNVVWLHGYGSNNWSFESTMKVMNMQMNAAAYIILPNAPKVDNKRSWYPLPFKDKDGKLIEDCIGLKNSIDMIDDFINTQKLDKEKKLIIGGFSQGAALSLSMSFASVHKTYGCIALSGYMPCVKIYTKTNINVKNVFIAHGFEDKAIEYEAYEKSLLFLKEKTNRITTSTGSFGHTVNKQVSDDLVCWFEGIINEPRKELI